MFEELKNIEPDDSLMKKYEALITEISSYGSAAVAFSGGVDSSLLLYAAAEALSDNVVAITVNSPSFPAREGEEAAAFCRVRGIRQICLESNELDIDGFSENPPDRCYICKHGTFSEVRHEADRLGLAEIMEGTNLDDEGDYRPGMKAIEELGVKSPLRKCGLTKKDIRILSRHFGLSSWNKPSFACLASRFPYGEYITAEKLGMVEKGEELLRSLGFEQFRVRIHGKDARIELLPSDFERFIKEEIRLRVHKGFREAGFNFISLDILGYRTGSMNEILGTKE